MAHVLVSTSIRPPSHHVLRRQRAAGVRPVYLDWRSGVGADDVVLAEHPRSDAVPGRHRAGDVEDGAEGMLLFV